MLENSFIGSLVMLVGSIMQHLNRRADVILTRGANIANCIVNNVFSHANFIVVDITHSFVAIGHALELRKRLAWVLVFLLMMRKGTSVDSLKGLIILCNLF